MSHSGTTKKVSHLGGGAGTTPNQSITDGAWAEEVAATAVARDIAEARDVDAANTRAANAVVREFIISRKLILYGGQSVDFAFRAADAPPLYADDKIADYDFYSPRKFEDAYDLADLLESKGFPDVKVISAMHPGTVRVGTAFAFVADVSGIDPAVYEYILADARRSDDGVYYVGPDWGRADIHIAFSFPYRGAPREDICFRFKKFLPRLRALDRLYPFPSSSGKHTPREDRVTLLLPDATGTKWDLIPDVAVSGGAGLGILARDFIFAAKKYGVAADFGNSDSEILEAAVGQELGSVLAEFATGAETLGAGENSAWAGVRGWPLDLVAGTVEAEQALARKFGNPNPYATLAPYLGERRLHGVAYEGGNVRVFSIAGGPGRVQGDILATAVSQRSQEASGPPLVVASGHFIALGFLTEGELAQMAGNETRAAEAAIAYQATLAVMSAGAQLIYQHCVEAGSDPRPVLEASPFGLPVRPLGDIEGNEGPSDVANRLKGGLDILYRERKKGRVTPAEVKKFESEITPIVYRPNNYRPGLRADGTPKDRPRVKTFGGPHNGRVILASDADSSESETEAEEGVRFVTVKPKTAEDSADREEPEPEEDQ